MKKQIKVSFLFTLFATLGLGVVYPALLSSIALFMPSVSRPSLLTKPGSKDFQGRPSFSGGPWSGASNLSLTNPKLQKQVEDRLKKLYLPPGPKIPLDLLFASASGCDPHLSPESALAQVSRIAQARNMDGSVLVSLVNKHTQPKLWGFIGTEMVDVAELNEALDKLRF